MTFAGSPATQCSAPGQRSAKGPGGVASASASASACVHHRRPAALSSLPHLPFTHPILLHLASLRLSVPFASCWCLLCGGSSSVLLRRPSAAGLFQSGASLSNALLYRTQFSSFTLGARLHAHRCRNLPVCLRCSVTLQPGCDAHACLLACLLACLGVFLFLSPFLFLSSPLSVRLLLLRPALPSAGRRASVLSCPVSCGPALHCIPLLDARHRRSLRLSHTAPTLEQSRQRKARVYLAASAAVAGRVRPPVTPAPCDCPVLPSAWPAPLTDCPSADSRNLSLFSLSITSPHLDGFSFTSSPLLARPRRLS